MVRMCGLGVRVMGVLMLRAGVLLCLRVMLRHVVHVRRSGQPDVWLRQEGVQLRAGVVARLVVRRVLPLLLLLLSVALRAATASSPTSSSAPVFHICAGCLRQRALQHI